MDSPDRGKVPKRGGGEVMVNAVFAKMIRAWVDAACEVECVLEPIDKADRAEDLLSDLIANMEECARKLEAE
jgi:hypothetical protein